MATLADLLGDLRTRLNDAGDTQVSQADKILYLNYGIKATWPDLYLWVRDATTTLVADTYEYNLPATFDNDARIFRVEVETTTAGKYVRMESGFTIFPGDPQMIQFDALPAAAGKKIRISGVKRLSVLANTTDTYDGPAGTEELPVLYAMGVTASRRLDDRLDHTRLSTVAAQNGVGVETIQGSAQFWFSQFDLALAKAAMPMPAATGF